VNNDCWDWVPLHMGNEWLFIAPSNEIFTVLCGSAKYQLALQNHGKLYLLPRCKGYSTCSNLYALCTIIQNNSKEDILLLAWVDLECCLTEVERDQLQNFPLQEPLTNILSSLDELNMAGVKISEVQELIDKLINKTKKFEHFKTLTSTWGGILLIFIIFVICICCSCCCCKCCRQCGFWLWDKWTPKECIRHTKERCCLITNINADKSVISRPSNSTLDTCFYPFVTSTYSGTSSITI
jgi:hypothetical protein